MKAPLREWLGVLGVVAATATVAAAWSSSAGL